MKNKINEIIKNSISVKQLIEADKEFIELIEKIANTLVHTFKNNGHVFFCGNGGSAADAQHLAAELSGRFYKDRDALPAPPIRLSPAAF